MNRVRTEAIRRSEFWWYCDNQINHAGEIGLLHMGFPRVFILIRDEEDVQFCSFEEFRDHIAEVNFFSPDEREDADIESLLIDAWNFMALSEEYDEQYCEDNDLL